MVCMYQCYGVCMYECVFVSMYIFVYRFLLAYEYMNLGKMYRILYKGLLTGAMPSWEFENRISVDAKRKRVEIKKNLKFFN
jgi:hypothetical protein